MTLMRSKDSRPWGLIIALALVAVVYVASLPLQVATYRSSQQVLRAGVEQNTRLVEQVRTLEEVGIRDVHNHQIANQKDHNCIVSLALLLADPRRNRAEAPVPPPECDGSPALKETK